MRYLITTHLNPPFLTDWYDYENFYNPDPALMMIIYDLHKDLYTIDGQTWQSITTDHL